MTDADPRTAQHRYLLTQLFYWEGRLDEMRRLVQERWNTSPNRAGDLRSLWQIDSAVVMVDLDSGCGRAGGAQGAGRRPRLAGAR